LILDNGPQTCVRIPRRSNSRWPEGVERRGGEEAETKREEPVLLGSADRLGTAVKGLGWSKDVSRGLGKVEEQRLGTRL